MPGSEHTKKPLQVEISAANLASKVDHTNLQPDATAADIELLCREAKDHSFFAVCINPCYVRLARNVLSGSPVKVCTVVGFPLGANASSTKQAETETALRDGAEEIDMVMNIGGFKSGQTAEVIEEIRQIVSIVKSAGAEKICKVIVESALLTSSEIERACKMVNAGGADFIKTSTGFSKAGGATVEAVNLMNRNRGKLKVKAAGGIKDLNTALAMLYAGADRLGTSRSVAILAELRENSHGR